MKILLIWGLFLKVIATTTDGHGSLLEMLSHLKIFHKNNILVYSIFICIIRKSSKRQLLAWLFIMFWLLVPKQQEQRVMVICGLFWCPCTTMQWILCKNNIELDNDLMLQIFGNLVTNIKYSKANVANIEMQKWNLLKKHKNLHYNSSHVCENMQTS